VIYINFSDLFSLPQRGKAAWKQTSVTCRFFHFVALANFGTVCLNCSLSSAQKGASAHLFGLLTELNLGDDALIHLPLPGKLGSFHGFAQMTNLRSLFIILNAPIYNNWCAFGRLYFLFFFNPENATERSLLVFFSVNFTHLTRFVKLDTLHLKSGGALDDSHLETIASLVNLTSLNLPGCGGLGEASLDKFISGVSNLVNLKRLDLRGFVFAEQLKEVSPPQQGNVGDFGNFGFVSFASSRRPEPLASSSASKLLDCLLKLPKLLHVTLPPNIKDWTRLNDSPMLESICLDAETLDRVLGGAGDALESLISRIEACNALVLFQGDYGWPQSLLVLASYSGPGRAVSKILEKPRRNPTFHVNYSGRGEPAIFLARTVEVVQLLIDAGADVNAISRSTTSGINTPLLAAISKGDHSLVKLLLDNNADPFVGLPVREAMSSWSQELFDHVWNATKNGLLEHYGDKELSKIVLRAFDDLRLQEIPRFLDLLKPVIGANRLNGYIKANEATIVSEYLLLYAGATWQSVRHAVEAGVDLRTPMPIEKSALWHLYVTSRRDSVREYIKEKGLLSTEECTAADAARARPTPDFFDL
jgi:hypothetical protein